MRKLLLALTMLAVTAVPTAAFAQPWGYYRGPRPYYGYRYPYAYGYYRPPARFYAPPPYPVYGPPVYPAPVYPAPAYGVGVGIAAPGIGIQFGS